MIYLINDVPFDDVLERLIVQRRGFFHPKHRKDQIVGDFIENLSR